MDVSMTASFAKLMDCTGHAQANVLDVSRVALNATMEMLGHAEADPDEQSYQVQLVTEAALLLFCFVICFFGFRFVRMVNLCVGFYLGGCLALFFLELSAPQIAQERCFFVVPLVAAIALLVAVLCAMKRHSLYFVLGAIAAQFFGKVSFDLLIMAGYGSTADGTTTNEEARTNLAARGCTSFFAVLGATLVYFYADVAWNAATALIGAYGTTFFTIKLVLIPQVDPKFIAFSDFRPESLGLRPTEHDIHYVYLPFVSALLLAIVGFVTQRACSKPSPPEAGVLSPAATRKAHPAGSPTRVMV